MNAAADVATPSLRALGAAVDLYKKVFTRPAIAAPHPLRHSGFDIAVVVESVHVEATDVVSLRLARPDSSPLPAWRPGAHIDVFLASGRQRQYSLCGDPRDRHRYRIAVRRIDDGDGGSREMHALRAGDTLRIRGPRNAFTFVRSAPSYLFVAAGIGITPLLPMAHAAGSRGRLVYLGRSRDTMPFLGEVPPDTDIRPDEETGPTDIPALLATAAPGAAVYVCGPAPILDIAQRSLFALNPTASLHTELFSARPVTDGHEFDIVLARDGQTVRVGSTETALGAIRRVRPDVVFSCRQGFCGTCKTRVVAGEIEHRDRLLTPDERTDHLLTCVSRSTGGALTLDL